MGNVLKRFPSCKVEQFGRNIVCFMSIMVNRPRKILCNKQFEIPLKSRHVLTKLLDVPESLKLWSVYNLHAQRMEVNVAVNTIVEHLIQFNKSRFFSPNFQATYGTFWSKIGYAATCTMNNALRYDKYEIQQQQQQIVASVPFYKTSTSFYPGRFPQTQKHNQMGGKTSKPGGTFTGY